LNSALLLMRPGRGGNGEAAAMKLLHKTKALRKRGKNKQRPSPCAIKGSKDSGQLKRKEEALTNRLTVVRDALKNIEGRAGGTTTHLQGWLLQDGRNFRPGEGLSWSQEKKFFRGGSGGRGKKGTPRYQR